MMGNSPIGSLGIDVLDDRTDPHGGEAHILDIYKLQSECFRKAIRDMI
jgi:hypothetical protein